MSVPSFVRLASALAMLAVGATVAGCPAPDPPKAPVAAPPKTDDDAKAALARAKKKGDPDALIEVFQKYGEFPAGKTALRLGVRKLLEEAIDAAERCDEPKAAGALARVAPYTPDDAEVDEAYDETKSAVSRERERCLLVKLDADVKKAEAAWEFARAFHRIASEKDAEGAALKKRRLELTKHWRAWLDDTLKAIVAKKSFDAALGDKRDAFEASVDPAQLPPEVAAELAKREGAIAGLRLVFEKLEGGEILDPPVRYWTFGAAKARRIDAPSASDGTVMPNGIPFTAVARGKIGSTVLLVAGEGEGSPFERLASIKLLIAEPDARRWDTRITLPEQLVGARVFAPIAPGSDTLAAATVLSEGAKGVVVVQPLSKKPSKVVTKRKDLRGLAMGPGQKVTVMIGGKAKPGELTDVPEEDRVLVRVAGFESFVPLGDVRVKRSELPTPPSEE